MINNNIFIEYYYRHPVPNPVNVTLTQKQMVNGQWIDNFVSEQNYSHFRNLLNSRILKSAYKRYGKELAMFVVRENDAIHRHHIHAIIEKPEWLEFNDFKDCINHCWSQTRYGYQETFIVNPITDRTKSGWVKYCLKKRSKTDLATSVDWINSTCFQRC